MAPPRNDLRSYISQIFKSLWESTSPWEHPISAPDTTRAAFVMFLKSKLDRKSTPIRSTNIKRGDTRLKSFVVVTCINNFNVVVTCISNARSRFMATFHGHVSWSRFMVTFHGHLSCPNTYLNLLFNLEGGFRWEYLGGFRWGGGGFKCEVGIHVGGGGVFRRGWWVKWGGEEQRDKR